MYHCSRQFFIQYHAQESLPLFQYQGSGKLPLFQYRGQESCHCFSIRGQESRHCFSIKGQESRHCFCIRCQESCHCFSKGVKKVAIARMCWGRGWSGEGVKTSNTSGAILLRPVVRISDVTNTLGVCGKSIPKVRTRSSSPPVKSMLQKCFFIYIFFFK